MCGDGPSVQKIPPFHSQAKLMDVLDRITGTQSVIVTGPDGVKRRIQEKLPYTAEEAKKFAAAEEMVSLTMNNILKLRKYDPKSAISFAPIIDVFANMSSERIDSLSKIADFGNIRQDFKAMQNDLIKEEYGIRNQQNEEALAHAGRGSGSYAAASRANMNKGEIQALQRANVESTMYGEELAAQRLGTNTDIFNLQESGRQGQLQSAEGQYGMLKQDEAEQEQRRLAAMQENNAIMGIGTGIQQAELNRNLQNTNAATSLNQFQAESNAELAAYNANANTIKANNDAEIEAYKNRSPGFGEIAANYVGNNIGQSMNFLSGGMSGGGGGGGFGSMISGGRSNRGQFGTMRRAK